MSGNRKTAWIYVALSFIVSIGAVIFQHILENSYLDRNGLYKAGVLTPEIFVVYAVLSALLILTVVFFIRFDTVPKDMKTGTVNTAIVSVIAAIALVYSSITFFMNDTHTFYASGTSEFMVHRLQLIASIAAFPAALYFMITAFMGKSKSKFVPYLSFFPIVWTLLLVMSMYFDRTALINSPVKSLQQFGLVVLMIYQLYEIRAHIGKTKMVANFVFSLVSTLFLSAAFVPTVIDVLLGTKSLTLGNMYCIACAVMAVYTLSRAIDFAIYPEIDVAKLVMERAREEREKAEKLLAAAKENEQNETDHENEVGDISEIEDLLDSLNAVADSEDDGVQEIALEEDALEETVLEETVSEEDVESEADVAFVEDVASVEETEAVEETVDTETTEDAEDTPEEVQEETVEKIEFVLEEKTADENEETVEEVKSDINEEATEEDDTLKRLKEFFGDSL